MKKEEKHEHYHLFLEIYDPQYVIPKEVLNNILIQYWTFSYLMKLEFYECSFKKKSSVQICYPKLA